MNEWEKFYLVKERATKEFVNLMNKMGCDSILSLHILDGIKAEIADIAFKNKIFDEMQNEVEQQDKEEAVSNDTQKVSEDFHIETDFPLAGCGENEVLADFSIE